MIHVAQPLLTNGASTFAGAWNIGLNLLTTQGMFFGYVVNNFLGSGYYLWFGLFFNGGSE